MQELKCPTCGRILKVVKDDPTQEQRKVTLHCKKCNSDVEFTVQ